MAFENRDATENVNVDIDTTVESIVFLRDRSYDDGGVKLDILVIREVDGVTVTTKVPRAIVISNWPGSSKTLQAHLLSIIDIT